MAAKLTRLQRDVTELAEHLRDREARS
jgi:hypothetical protein